MEVSSSVYEETSFFQGAVVRSYNGKNVWLPSGRIAYCSESSRSFMQKFTEYNEDDYIAFVGLKLAEKWALNMQTVRRFSGDDLSKDVIESSLNAAKITITPYHVEEENVNVAKEILIAHWAYGNEFAKAEGLDEQDVRRIQGKATVQTMLHENYTKSLKDEKIDFSTPLMEKYWNFKAVGGDVIDKDCFDLASDWIKVAQLFMKATGDKELTEDILYESALQVRKHNTLLKTENDSNVLKIRDDYYNRVVQAMICCWKQGENVGKIHSTDDANIAKIRRFPVRDSSFKCYMKGRGSVLWQYAVEKVRAKIRE